jgi:hypothetical protein
MNDAIKPRGRGRPKKVDILNNTSVTLTKKKPVKKIETLKVETNKNMITNLIGTKKTTKKKSENIIIRLPILQESSDELSNHIDTLSDNDNVENTYNNISDNVSDDVSDDSNSNSDSDSDSDNDSNSDNDNDDDNDNDKNSKKKIINKTENNDNDDNDDNNNDSSSDKNLFTTKDETDKNSNYCVFSISDVESEESNNYYIIKQLKKENKNLLTENKKLQDDLKQFNKIKEYNYSTETKEIVTTIVDINLMDRTGNKIIVEKTDICCWWDHRQFDTMPCFIPEKIVGDTYYVFGCFCSFNCALKYNNSKINDHRSLIRKSLLLSLCEKIYGKLENIQPAYEVEETLKDYGLGNLTIEEFRNKHLILTKNIKITIPPVHHMIYKKEEYSRDT